MAGERPANLGKAFAKQRKGLVAAPVTVATRKASELALETAYGALPELLSGSADLTPSNNTKAKGFESITPRSFKGRYLHYGIREHAMAAAMNGMALHGGLVPAGGTFFVFTDYCRPAIRLSALMGVGVVYVMTHDSIGLGEDGPTHQPVEHLASLRAMPNLRVFRPCDAVETSEAWELALGRTDGPTILVLTRQNLAQQRSPTAGRTGWSRAPTSSRPARRGCRRHDLRIRLRGRDRHGARAAAGGEGRFGPRRLRALARALPAAARGGARRHPRQGAGEGGGRGRRSPGWDAIVGPDGGFVGMSSFGASAPYKDLYKHFGITAEAVAAEVLKRHNG